MASGRGTGISRILDAGSLGPHHGHARVPGPHRTHGGVTAGTRYPLQVDCTVADPARRQVFTPITPEKLANVRRLFSLLGESSGLAQNVIYLDDQQVWTFPAIKLHLAHDDTTLIEVLLSTMVGDEANPVLIRAIPDSRRDPISDRLITFHLNYLYSMIASWSRRGRCDEGIFTTTFRVAALSGSEHIDDDIRIIGERYKRWLSSRIPPYFWIATITALSCISNLAQGVATLSIAGNRFLTAVVVNLSGNETFFPQQYSWIAKFTPSYAIHPDLIPKPVKETMLHIAKGIFVRARGEIPAGQAVKILFPHYADTDPLFVKTVTTWDKAPACDVSQPSTLPERFIWSFKSLSVRPGRKDDFENNLGTQVTGPGGTTCLDMVARTVIGSEDPSVSPGRHLTTLDASSGPDPTPLPRS